MKYNGRKTLKAKKDLPCSLCGGVIAKGAMYTKNQDAVRTPLQLITRQKSSKCSTCAPLPVS